MRNIFGLALLQRHPVTENQTKLEWLQVRSAVRLFRSCLLVRLFVIASTSSSLASSALAGNTTGPTLAIGRGYREVDVFLGVHPYHELGHVHELLANTAVPK